MTKDQEELKNQVGLALAGLGLAFAQVLGKDDVPPAVLASLRSTTARVHDHLQDIGANDAADMLVPFARALHDKSLLP